MKRLKSLLLPGFMLLCILTATYGCYAPKLGQQALALNIKTNVTTIYGEQEIDGFGSGVFVSPDLAATNSHVAERATQIDANDDEGNRYSFDRIVWMDPEKDLALIRLKKGYQALQYAKVIKKPEQPRDLRQTEILLYGNTGGIAKSLFQYLVRITNVDDKFPIRFNQNLPLIMSLIMFDHAASNGASGGPLFIKSNNELVGINQGSIPSMNTAIAIPAWFLVEPLAKSGAGMKLKDAFNPHNLDEDLIEPQTSHKFCLEPGQAKPFPFPVTDEIYSLAYKVVPDQPGRYSVELVQNDFFIQNTFSNKMYYGKAVETFALLKGAYTLYITTSKYYTGKSCFEVSFGRAAWEKRFNGK